MLHLNLEELHYPCLYRRFQPCPLLFRLIDPTFYMPSGLCNWNELYSSSLQTCKYIKLTTSSVKNLFIFVNNSSVKNGLSSIVLPTFHFGLREFPITLLHSRRDPALDSFYLRPGRVLSELLL